MAAREDHPQLTVLDLGVEKPVVDALVLRGPSGNPLAHDTAAGFIAPQRINDSVFGDAMNPAGRVVGHAAGTPRLQGLEQRGLHHFLDEIEVPPAEVASQYGYQL